MTDIRTCLQRLVDIWDGPNLRHELPGAMWHAKEALKAPPDPQTVRPCPLGRDCQYPDCLHPTGNGLRCVETTRA